MRLGWDSRLIMGVAECFMHVMYLDCTVQPYEIKRQLENQSYTCTAFYPSDFVMIGSGILSIMGKEKCFSNDSRKNACLM